MFNFLEQALKSLTKKCIAGINTGIFGGGGTGMRAICICYDVASHDILGEECCLHQEELETELLF